MTQHVYLPLYTKDKKICRNYGHRKFTQFHITYRLAEQLIVVTLCGNSLSSSHKYIFIKATAGNICSSNIFVTVCFKSLTVFQLFGWFCAASCPQVHGSSGGPCVTGSGPFPLGEKWACHRCWFAGTKGTVTVTQIFWDIKQLKYTIEEVSKIFRFPETYQIYFPMLKLRLWKDIACMPGSDSYALTIYLSVMKHWKRDIYSAQWKLQQIMWKFTGFWQRGLMKLTIVIIR